VEPEAPSAAPAELRAAVLLNAKAGSITEGGEAEFGQSLAALFARHGMSATLEFVEHGRLIESAERARKGAESGAYDLVVVGGGDGTVRTLAGILAGSDVPLGVLPLGTLNHFAKDLSISLDMDGAVRTLSEGHIRVVDLGEVNGHFFINNSSVGIYPSLVVERDRRMKQSGQRKFVAMMGAALSTVRKFTRHKMRIVAVDGFESCRTPCLFVGNNTYSLAGRSLGSRARLDEGRLSFYVSKQKSALALLATALRALFGRLDYERDVRILHAVSAEVHSHKHRALVALDGEVKTLSFPLRYRIRPGALRVIAPQPAIA